MQIQYATNDVKDFMLAMFGPYQHDLHMIHYRWNLRLTANRNAINQLGEDIKNGKWLRARTCPYCGGEGANEVSEPQHDDPYYARVVKCSECNGSGYVEALTTAKPPSK